MILINSILNIFKYHNKKTILILTKIMKMRINKIYKYKKSYNILNIMDLILQNQYIYNLIG